MYKHIVFDFDGTLVNSAEVMFKVFNNLAEKYCLKGFAQEDFRQFKDLAFKKKLRLFLFMIQKEKEFKYIYKQNLSAIMLFDGVEELLYRLKEKGFIVSILTSNAADNIWDYLQLRGLNIIDDIHSSKGLFGKSAALKKYMRKHRLSNKEVIYVGDELRDIKACKKLNIDIISVTWGIEGKEYLQATNTKFVIDEWSQIYDIIN